MTWWLIPSIIGVIIAGIAVGLLISTIIFKIRKQQFQKKMKPVTESGPTASSVKAVPGTITLYEPQKATARKSNPQTNPRRKDIKLVIPDGPPDPKPKPAPTPESAPVSNPAHPVPRPIGVLEELEYNLAIACKPKTPHLINFQTDVWNSRRADFDSIGKDLLSEVSEAYVDMLLANNLVWLVTELKRESQDLSDSYLNLKSKIAERLQRIMPEIRKTLQQDDQRLR